MTNIYKNPWKDNLPQMIHFGTSFGKDVVLGFGVIIEKNVKIGNNVFIGHYTHIRPNVVIGDDSEIRAFCTLAGDNTIGKKVKIFQYSNISKGTIIEDRAYIGAKVLTTNTRRIAHLRDYKPNLQGVHICYGARIGSGSKILPGITIGKNASIGLGAIVTKDVAENAIVYGDPGTYRGEVPEEERV